MTIRISGTEVIATIDEDAGFGSVMQYFFGSSNGNSDKTTIIAAQK